MSEVEFRQGDLLGQRDADAIVNAWNRNFIPWWLLLPAGVSGAIKRHGGHAPFRELRRYGMLAAGDAVMTSAGRLPFRAIIHVAALNALWTSSETIVRLCTTNALTLAATSGFNVVAFPLIGAGTGGVNTDIARATIEEASLAHPYSGRVVVVRHAP